MKRMISAGLVLIPMVSVQAHHSFFGRFDTTASMELEGVVKKVMWSNPHAHFILEVEDGGSVVEWDLESGSPTLMTRAC